MTFFFFNNTPHTEIYTLSLHDALPISEPVDNAQMIGGLQWQGTSNGIVKRDLNSAVQISRSEEHTSELQSPDHLVCRLLLEKKKTITQQSVHRALLKNVTCIALHACLQ